MDWLGFILGITGAVLTARKHKSCWLIFMLSSISWIIYSALTKQIALLLEAVGFLIINIYGWIKWNKKV